jgi:hypothetical protein
MFEVRVWNGGDAPSFSEKMVEATRMFPTEFGIELRDESNAVVWFTPTERLIFCRRVSDKERRS